MLMLFTGKFSYLSAFLWGIKIGKGSRFYGKTNFYKEAKSKITIGDNCTFRSAKKSNWIGVDRPCMISTHGRKGAEVIIGDNCGFTGTVIGAFEKITLGNGVRCGSNTLITDSDWHLDDKRVGKPKQVTLGDNVWLGVNAVVLKGVSIGKNSIIGANSVVVSDIPENVIAAGNPCRVIKKI